MLTAHASALAAFDSNWIEEEVSARPVRTAISAATQTASSPISTERGRSPRRQRTTATTAPTASAAPTPAAQRPPADQPARPRTPPAAGSRRPRRAARPADPPTTRCPPTSRSAPSASVPGSDTACWLGRARPGRTPAPVCRPPSPPRPGINLTADCRWATAPTGRHRPLRCAGARDGKGLDRGLVGRTGIGPDGRLPRRLGGAPCTPRSGSGSTRSR